MTYATDLVQQYRLALHHIWNVHFWDSRVEKDWDLVKEFNTLKLPLFNALVAARLAPQMASSGQIFGEEYKVISKIAQGPNASISSLRVDIGLPKGPGSCWEEIEGHFRPAEIKLTLLDFFDWTELSWRDFHYYRVRIHQFDKEPAFVGREALVENWQVDVIWESSFIIGAPVSRKESG